MTGKGEPPKLSADEIADDLYDDAVRQAAQQFGLAAVDNLAELAASGPRAVRRGASNDLITLGKKTATSRLEQLAERASLDREIHFHFTTFALEGPKEEELIIPRAEEKLGIVEELEVEDAEEVVEDPLMNLVISNPAGD